MQRKIFPLCEGGGGGWPQPPSEDQFCENFLSILTFSRGKNNFDQSCSLWCQKLKKIGCKLSHSWGGGSNPKCDNYHTFFFYFDGFPYLTFFLHKTYSNWWNMYEVIPFFPFDLLYYLACDCWKNFLIL